MKGEPKRDVETALEVKAEGSGKEGAVKRVAGEIRGGAELDGDLMSGEEQEEDCKVSEDKSDKARSDYVSFVSEKSQYSRKPRKVVASLKKMVLDMLLFEPPGGADTDLPVLLLTHGIFVNASIYGTALPNLLASYGFVVFVLNSLGHGKSSIPSIAEPWEERKRRCCPCVGGAPAPYRMRDMKDFLKEAIKYVRGVAKDASNGSVALITHGSSDIVVQSILIDNEAKKYRHHEHTTLNISKVVRLAPFGALTAKHLLGSASTNARTKARMGMGTLHIITETAAYRSKALGKGDSPWVKGIPDFAYALLGPSSPVDALLIAQRSLGEEPYALIKELSAVDPKARFTPGLNGMIYNELGIKTLVVHGIEDALVSIEDVYRACSNLRHVPLKDAATSPTSAQLIGVEGAGHLVQLSGTWSSITHTIAIWLSFE